ncbi:MAG: zinc-ribbon domain-containing protein [Lachnospiraceae bacterium]|nr:zinc-ribbon domain-containing protein [Lachnospiraceae bacterium]
MEERIEKKYTKNRKLIVGENDLLTWCKEHGEQGQIIINEWDASKNGSMTCYKPGSSIAVYWKCSICNATYVKAVKYRVMGKIHEPCGIKRGIEKSKQYNKDRIKFEDSLAGKYPELLEEWDYETNTKMGYDPKYLSAYSAIKANWICKKCGNKWSVGIRYRTAYGSKCKACNHK